MFSQVLHGKPIQEHFGPLVKMIPLKRYIPAVFTINMPVIREKLPSRKRRGANCAAAARRVYIRNVLVLYTTGFFYLHMNRGEDIRTLKL